MSSTPLQTIPGYQAAVAEESRSHDDVSSHATLTTAYRELVRDCVLMEPLHGFVDISDLPDLNMEDLALIRQAKCLTSASVEELMRAVLTDAQAEAELQNERRAEARDQEAFERYHGGDSPFNERERLESEYGLGRLFK